jgi:CheY-like chemotaxis protein
VVWNLVNNAVKFTPTGGRVKVTLHRTRDLLIIEVKDTGQGIAPAFLPHVFERFRQADSSRTRPHSGLGLGLAISRQLVELHGGRISVESAGLGKGSVFTVELPAGANISKTKGEPAPEVQQPIQGAGFAGKPVLQNVQILLVEDEVHSRDAVAWLLEQSSAKVVAVASVAAALRELEPQLAKTGQRQTPGFDLLISDIAMPQQDGYELMRQLRKLERANRVPPLPAIALTAYVRERHRAQALEAGFAEYLPKPVDPDTLIAAALRLAPKAREIRAEKN